MKFEELEHTLLDLPQGSLPQPRVRLTEKEKVTLIRDIGGIHTVNSILRAAEKMPRERVPFLFTSIDTQLVVDVLYNDMREALAYENGEPSATAPKKPAAKKPTAKTAKAASAKTVTRKKK